MRYFVAMLLALFVATPAFAGPRDELLRVAPPDAALVVVVQNAREHIRNLTDSPFAAWFPTTSIGKKLFDSPELKQFRESTNGILSELGITKQELFDDVLGDAVGFGFSPAPPGKPNGERAVLLIRPRKPDVLAKLIDKVNELQTKSSELKAVVRREHAGVAYFERQKQEGAAEFYCFRGDVFAFSSSEADITAVIDRDKANAPAGEKVPELVARMQKLGVADAAAVLLVNPRALDAEMQARLAAAKPDEKRFLEKFAEAWSGLESAAVSISLDKDIEIDLSLRFHPEKLPASAKAWLIGPRGNGGAKYLIPKDALVGVAGSARATEMIELAASLAPLPADRPGVKDWIAQTLGPIVGRNNLPALLDSLGPNWAIWAESPTSDAIFPTLIAALELGGEGEARAKTEKALAGAMQFGFQMVRVAYNARHADQIELREEKDGKSGATIISLMNDKGFPPGFRPSFALTRGYFVVATSPDAIKRFNPLVLDGPLLKGYTTLAKVSGTWTRLYFQTHGAKLAKFLAEFGAGDEKTLRGHIDDLASVLELVESADLISRDIENGVRLGVRVKPAKALK